MGQKKIILLFGPTASGKSKLSIDIAKKFNGEIINADSMQVYKEVKILSARPNDRTVRHHLYGIISAKNHFSAGLWYKQAIKKIKEINKQGRTAIITGGTGLYFKILVDGLVEIPQVPKADYSDVVDEYKKKYPRILEGINLSDTQRISRAIAVYKYTGISLNDWQKKENKKYFKSDVFAKILLNPSKMELEKRIKKRFIKMLKNGAIKEVKDYRRLNLLSNSLYSANSIIGLNEIALFLEKRISMDELKEKVLIRTRQYAKRQFTWLRGQMKDWKGFTDTNYLDLRKKVLSYLSKT